MKLLLPLLLIFSISYSKESDKLRSLYHSLNPNSIKENIAFYSLFNGSDYGNKALERSMDLINKHRDEKIDVKILKNWPSISLVSMVQSIGKKMNTPSSMISYEDVELIGKLSSHLKHHNLPGHQKTHFNDINTLTDNEIDVARFVFLYQFNNDLEKVLSYEAALDLMALEILAKVSPQKTLKELLHAMHELIFFEMEFRFPPHSLWAKDVDTYTFLPSVMDDRFGVCLGVSILYIALGQRLGLSFNIFTPPGHIFIQAKSDDESLVNIETTARGIHIPMEQYLGINGLYLEKRTLKETVAFALMNFAATFWEAKKYEEALKIYLVCETMMPFDPLLHYFISINSLFCNKPKEAKIAYEIYKSNLRKDVIKEETLLEDYFEKKVDVESLKTIFSSVDETRDSIIKKQEELLKVTKKFPTCREGFFHLGITYLQLSQLSKAQAAFDTYHKLDKTNPTVEYYLAHLCLNRLDYKKAFEHLSETEKLFKAHEKSLKILKPLRMELMKYICLNPS